MSAPVEAKSAKAQKSSHSLSKGDQWYQTGVLAGHRRGYQAGIEGGEEASYRAFDVTKRMVYDDKSDDSLKKKVDRVVNQFWLSARSESFYEQALLDVNSSLLTGSQLGTVVWHDYFAGYKKGFDQGHSNGFDVGLMRKLLQTH